MNHDNGNTCGNCTSAARATTRAMEGMLWCSTGQAARRAGMGTIQAVYLSFNRPACTDFSMRKAPVPDAPAPQEETAPAAEIGLQNHDVSTGVGEDFVLPWDLPDAHPDPLPAISLGMKEVPQGKVFL